MIQAEQILELPVEALSDMLTESKTANFRAIDRLIQEWTTHANRFDHLGEALFIARQGDRILGICGLNRDPYTQSAKVGRVRRLYVMQNSRRQGIGRMLVHRVIQAAKDHFEWLHVRTSDPIAVQFYQSLGFIRCDNEFVTHTLQLTTFSFKE